MHCEEGTAFASDASHGIPLAVTCQFALSVCGGGELVCPIRADGVQRLASVGAAHSIEVTIRNSLAALHCTQLFGALVITQSNNYLLAVGGSFRLVIRSSEIRILRITNPTSTTPMNARATPTLVHEN